MAQPYVGEIRMFAGNFVPAGCSRPQDAHTISTRLAGAAGLCAITMVFGRSATRGRTYTCFRGEG